MVVRWRRLGNLAHDFTHAASVYVCVVLCCVVMFCVLFVHSLFCFSFSYGRILISERFLPVSAKTIKPITSLGGSAGGLKYICGGKWRLWSRDPAKRGCCAGIMFKFCVDTPLVGDSWMYGGATASGTCARCWWATLFGVLPTLPQMSVP